MKCPSHHPNHDTTSSPSAHRRLRSRRRLLTGALTLTLMVLSLSAIAQAHGPHQGPGVTHAHGPVILEVPSLSQRQLARMQDPVVIDRARLVERVATITRHLNRLERVAAGVRDPRLRASLERQIDQLRGELDAIERQLARAHSVAPVIDVVEIYDEALAVLPSVREYDQLRQTLDQVGFHDERLDTLAVISNRHVFTTAQIRGLAELFPFNDDRLDALILLYPRSVDPENYHTLLKLLPFSKHRARLLTVINRSDTGRRALPTRERRRRR